MKNEVKIFVAAHKKYNRFESNIYIPIHVGASLSGDNFGYLRDDTKENISDKNKNYCELTALYWIWKNCSADIKGLCHYRRYLSTKDVDINQKYFLNDKIINRDLEEYDIIIPKKRVLKKRSCRENYLLGEGIEKDLNNLQLVIQRIYPEYNESYIKILEGNICSYCNVMICRRELFDNYSKWLFDILFELEKITDLTNYSVAQARVYGYLSEILLNVWIDKNKLRCKQYSLINTEVPKNIKYNIKLYMEKLGVYRVALKLLKK